MTDADMLQVMGNDARLWARQFVLTLYLNDIVIDEGLMIAWFVNAMMAQQDSLTAKQAIDIAISRVHFHEVTGEAYAEDGVEHRTVDPAYRELDLAKTKLEEAQMWFTRALAMRQGKFDPADLEQDNGD